MIYGNFSTDVLTINGDVGIGTTSPSNIHGWQRVLDVRGNQHSKIIATTASGGIKAGVYSDDSQYGGSAIIGTESNHNIHLIANYSPKLSILTNGNVGIGTTSPTEALDVNGSARIRTISQDNSLTKILAADANGKMFWRDAGSLEGGTGGDNLGSHIITQNLIPISGNSIDIGNSENGIRDLYISRRINWNTNSNIFIGNGTGNVNTTGYS